MRTRWARLAALMILLTALTGGCGDSGSDEIIQILWAQWDPANYLDELSQQFTEETGIPVRIVQKSWTGGFGPTTMNEFRNRSDTYDLIIGDSQWMGMAVTGSHYVELTDWLEAEVDQDAYVPASWKWYCEYPKGAGRYYAVPCEADAMAWAYRKDLFESEEHRSAFRTFLEDNGQTPFDLAPPETWTQLAWIARYFSEKVPGMVGLVMPTSRDYDCATMSFQQVMWAFGGEYGDYTTNEVKVDSPATVEALRFFSGLLQNTSEAGKNLGYSDVAGDFLAGRAAMLCNFLAFFPAIASEEQNADYWDEVAYFNMPSHTDESGTTRRFATLGGQGLSINAHISPERQERAKQYLKWFLEKETQQEWAKLGGFTSHREVLASEEFKQATDYNPLFEEAFGMLRDFWALPKFDELMKVCQREFCAVFQDGADPAKAAANVQQEHERILNR